MKMSYKLFPHFKINLLFFPLLISSIIFGYFVPFALSYLCAMLHELCHVAVAVKLNVGIEYIELQPFGICARLKSNIIKSPAAEIAIAAAGPFFNLILASACKYVGAAALPQGEYFIICNIAIAIINMLPALPLDGGRILRAALTMRLGSLRAYNITVKLSRIPIAALILASIYTLLTARFNFSLILIGVFLLGNLFIEQHNISRLTLEELLSCRTKLSGGELVRSTVITAHKSTPARKILHMLSYSHYHIIHVVDDNFRVIKTLTEGQLLSALTIHGIRVTLGDI